MIDGRSCFHTVQLQTIQVTYTGSNLIREAWEYCVQASMFAACGVVFGACWFSITVWIGVEELPPATVKRLLRGLGATLCGGSGAHSEFTWIA